MDGLFNWMAAMFLATSKYLLAEEESSLFGWVTPLKLADLDGFIVIARSPWLLEVRIVFDSVPSVMESWLTFTPRIFMAPSTLTIMSRPTESEAYRAILERKGLTSSTLLRLVRSGMKS